MSTRLDARHIDHKALPLIDVSGLYSSQLATRKAVALELRKACENTGFFYCIGHGVPQGLMDAVLAEAKLFFAQPEGVKLQYDRMKRPKASRGYEVFGGQVLEEGAPPDRKEGFVMGLELPEDDPRVLAGHFDRGPNVWPSDLPGFRPTMSAYYQAMRTLSEVMLDGIALSLGLNESYFDDYKREPIATLRLLHYPPQPKNALPNEKGAGAHTDWGSLTLLLQDEVGGLQVFDNNKEEWLHAEPIPGSFVVNIGDAMANWTNDLYQSTMHRVVNTSNQHRYSVPYFFDGKPDYQVVCMPTCLKPGEQAKYAPITVEQHLKNMIQKTYG